MGESRSNSVYYITPGLKTGIIWANTRTQLALFAHK